MKFECFKCKAETSFDQNDYINKGQKQQLETVIRMYTTPTPKMKEILVPCSNPDCKEPNKLTITYYE